MLLKRNVLKFVLALLLIAFCAGPVAAVEQKPNVVLVFIDDMGWADFSCFGNADAQTPQIDRMADEGVSFEQFYVNSPICSPSRVAISTGQYPQRWNITSYLAARRLNEKRGIANWLDLKAPVLARSLQKAGYATGHFGKWHMGGQRDVAEAPQISQYGFDQSLTNFEGMGAKLLPLTMKGDGTVGRIWEKAEVLGKPVTWMQRSKITGGFVDAAIPFMKKAMQDNKPFYVNVWPDDVHGPYWPPASEYDAAAKLGKRGLYLAVLEAMDRQLGKLFTFIRSNPKLCGNTLVLICSDNGPEPGAGRAGVFRGHKTQLYEGGVRSPLIAWAPGLMKKQAQGSRNKTSVFAAIDLVPSLLALTSTKPPAGVTYDGENLLPVLTGASTASRRQPIFFSRPPDRKSFYGVKELPDLAVRHGQWKLLCNYDGAQTQLYNLSKDPGETTNIAAAEPAQTATLKNKVLKWWAEVK